MEKLAIGDVITLYQFLYEIKEPSAKVKEMLSHLDDHFYTFVMGMKIRKFKEDTDGVF